MKSTPGPWEISNSGRQVGKRALNGSLNLLADTTNSCFYEEDEANAHLIAAAPEMLDFIVLVVESQEWDGNNPDEEKWSDFYAKARAIIAKIEGK